MDVERARPIACSATTASRRAIANRSGSTVDGNFLVAAYRRPEFRVDVTLNAPTSIAGTKLDGTISGQLSLRRARWRRGR